MSSVAVSRLATRATVYVDLGPNAWFGAGSVGLDPNPPVPLVGALSVVP
jgi:hypothetical protein